MATGRRRLTTLVLAASLLTPGALSFAPAAGAVALPPSAQLPVPASAAGKSDRTGQSLAEKAALMAVRPQAAVAAAGDEPSIH